MDFRKNYFELFGLAQGFELDLKQLGGRYRDLQKELHPDKFANASDQERRLSLQQAAQVNSAYQTLKDPLQRARYLLELAGVAAESSATISDMEFLEEQIELREALADIRDAAEPEVKLAEFLDLLAGKEKGYVGALTKDFALGDEQALARAAADSNKLQFIRKLHDEALLLEEELF